MRTIFFIILFTACAQAADNVINNFSDIHWSINGTFISDESVNSSGRMEVQTQVSGGSTAFDLYPTAGVQPTTDSYSEITLHRTVFNGNDQDMERFNISAMVNANNGAYRFGVERGALGQFRDIIFCFENVTPGVAVCPFKITVNGVYISHDGGNNWSQL